MFNIVQGSIIAPLVYGKAVSLHPAIVLLAIPAGGQLAGVVGMFLAVPVLGLIAASWRSVLQVLGDRPPTPSVATDSDSTDPPESDPSQPDPEPRGCRRERLTASRRTWIGAGRVPAEARPDPRRRESVLVGRAQIPSAFALAAANSSSDRIPCEWSCARFCSWAICGSSAGAAGSGAGA